MAVPPARWRRWPRPRGRPAGGGSGGHPGSERGPVGQLRRWMVGDMSSGEDLRSLFARVLDSVVESPRTMPCFCCATTSSASSEARAARWQNLPLAMLDHRTSGAGSTADLVMTSREPLTVSGGGLRRFAVASDLQAAAYVPLRQSTAIGVLAVSHRRARRSAKSRPGAQNAGKSHRHRPVNARLLGVIASARRSPTARRIWPSARRARCRCCWSGSSSRWTRSRPS